MRSLVPPLFLVLLVCCAPAAEPPPSVVFVSVDTLAARHMSLYGYARDTTPGLRRLAEDAVVFERCWANAPWTTPSYMSQFTGLYAEAFRTPPAGSGDEEAWTFSDEHTTLAELFRAAGHRTAAFVDNPNVGPHWGFDQGFEVYDTSAAEIPLEDPGGGVELVVPQALEWLDALGEGEPFFLFLQVLDVHGPYLAGREHAGAFADAPTSVVDREVPVALGHESILGAIPLYVAEPFLDGDPRSLPVRPFVDAYDEGIRAMDDALVDLVRELEARGVLDRAFLVVTADHGESLVEHESYFDHQLLHGEELHVPLFVRPPGGVPGRRVAADVQLVDLYPTLAEAIGVLPPRAVHGRSLLAALRGEELAAAPSVGRADFLDARSIVVDGWKLVETRPTPVSAGIVGYLTTPRARAWIGEHYPELRGKVFGTHELPLAVLEGVDESFYEDSREALTGPFVALFDLRSDPGELHDVAAEHPELVRELRRALEAETARARSAFLAGEAPPELDEATRAALEKLGYTDGG